MRIVYNRKFSAHGKQQKSTPFWQRYFKRTRPDWWGEDTPCNTQKPLWTPVESANYSSNQSSEAGTFQQTKSLLFKLRLFLIVVIGVSLAPLMGNAAILNIQEPLLGSSNVVLDMEATNNNNGSIYNSADLNLTSQLASDLWALDANQSTYATMQDMIADWDMNIRTPPTGEVSNGWDATANSDGSFSLTNQSTTGGEIGTDYDGWYSTAAAPTSDMQFYTINIPKSQLEFDGTPGYDPLTDASIVLSGAGNTMSDAFVATQDSLNSYQAESQYFTVQVPEVSSSALLMGGLAAMVAAFRRRLSRSVLPFVA